MIKAKPSDKKMVCGLLASSFADNPSVNYIIAGGNRKSKRLVALMEYSFELCFRFGEVWLSDDSKGCALVLFPHKKRLGLLSVWLDVKLVFNAISLNRVFKILAREQLIAEKHSNGDRAHLLFIGVKPLYQRTGVGSCLLAEILKRMDGLELPVYLETSVPENLSWYKKFGFKVYDQIELGYQLFLLARKW